MRGAQSLRRKIRWSINKLKIFESEQTMNKYSLTVREFCDIIEEFLTDEEKSKLFEFPYFQNLEETIRYDIISTIKDEAILKEVLKNEKAIKGFDKFRILRIFIERDEKTIFELLKDKEFISNKMRFDKYTLNYAIKSLSSDEDKKELMSLYVLEKNIKVDIIKTFKNKENKLEELNKKEYSKHNKIDIIKSFTSEQLIDFIKNYRDICEENDIEIHEITCELKAEQQLELTKKIEELNITLNEKRKILALLNQEVKEQIDTTNLPEEYKKAIKMKNEENSLWITEDLEGYKELDFMVRERGEKFSWIKVDFNQNLEVYRGLDDIIRENAQNLNQEQREKFLELCDICPNMEVISNIDSLKLSSTPAEYKKGEEWIEGVLSSIKPEYTDAQKIAIIDNAIGKKISYTPNLNIVKKFKLYNPRALWTIIDKGYGICSGIANLMEYMLKRVGIENVKQVNSSSHAFLKIEDIELPLANGEKVKGNTIVDPTWNLSENRFGAWPQSIFINYETARKNDIDSMGYDQKSHKNDEELLDATLELDDKSFRELYKSVGLTDKEGNFPIKNIIEKSENIDKIYANQPEKNIDEQFVLLKEICPEYTTCQISTIGIISSVLLQNKNQQIKRGNVDIVYEKADKNKEPVLYTYIELENSKELFYYADKKYEQLIKISKEEFEEKFACYKEKLREGIEPWRIGKTEEKLEKEEGEER